MVGYTMQVVMVYPDKLKWKVWFQRMVTQAIREACKGDLGRVEAVHTG